jgi:hypothetical protein
MAGAGSTVANIFGIAVGGSRWGAVPTAMRLNQGALPAT